MAKVIFKGSILVIGCGSVSQCTLPLLPQLLDVPYERITVIDFVDNRARIKELLERGVTYVQQRITPDNLVEILGQYLKAGDILIDLAWNIETIEMLEWCRERSVLFINTSVEKWDPYADRVRQDPRNYTLYSRQMELRALVQKWGSNNGPSAIVDHGANPGLVSHFTKHALIGITQKLLECKPHDPRVQDLKAALAAKDFKRMARLAQVQVIHISERDSQDSSVPRRVNEFVNTWSIEGLYEEGVAPAEMGWGTHEKSLPPGAVVFEDGPCNQICLSSLGMNTFARSWVPSGPIVGMIIRHGEAFGISDHLTVWEGNRAVYRPTVHYVYCPSDAAIASLYELRMRQYKLQSDQRILSDEIISGQDELGVLLMGHDFKSWWTGSILDIEEARRLVPHQNATTVQVAISVIAAVLWMLKNPTRGFCLPDDIDHEEILKISRPFLGKMVSEPIDWTPLDNIDTTFTNFGAQTPKVEDCWQFSTFQRGAGL